MVDHLERHFTLALREPRKLRRKKADSGNGIAAKEKNEAAENGSGKQKCLRFIIILRHSNSTILNHNVNLCTRGAILMESFTTMLNDPDFIQRFLHSDKRNDRD